MTISTLPAVVQLRYAITASVRIRMDAFKVDGTPFDLTPYVVTAPFVADSGRPAPIGSWTLDIEPSSIVLSLSEVDTAALAPDGKSMTWHWNVWLDHATVPERILFARGDLGLVQG